MADYPATFLYPEESVRCSTRGVPIVRNIRKSQSSRLLD